MQTMQTSFPSPPGYDFKQKKEKEKRKKEKGMASAEFSKKSKKSKCEKPRSREAGIPDLTSSQEKGFPGNAKCFVQLQNFPVARKDRAQSLQFSSLGVYLLA